MKKVGDRYYLHTICTNCWVAYAQPITIVSIHDSSYRPGEPMYLVAPQHSSKKDIPLMYKCFHDEDLQLTVKECKQVAREHRSRWFGEHDASANDFDCPKCHSIPAQEPVK